VGAGATGIDLFLLVLDAAEGARPQTHEHLAILRLLGVDVGVDHRRRELGLHPEPLAHELDRALARWASVAERDDAKGRGDDREHLGRAPARHEHGPLVHERAVGGPAPEPGGERHRHPRIVDPLAHLLTAFQLDNNKQWRELGTWVEGAVVRIEPFGELELNLSEVWV